MIASVLTRALGLALMLGTPVLVITGVPWLHARVRAWVVRRFPPGPPRAPSDAAWLLFPFQAVFVAAWGLWLLLALAVFLAPLGALAWLVLR